MAFWTSAAAARTARLVGLLLLSAASAAFADPFYWQAQRSSDWSKGINAGGVSNWYAGPAPNGQARGVPGQSDTAVFGNGARSFTVAVTRDQTRIGKISVNRIYTFDVSPLAGIVMHGDGFFSSSMKAPRVNIRPLGEVILKNRAQFHSSTATRAALIYLERESNLVFRDNTVGGTAWVQNEGGSVRFYEQSSARGMKLTNIARIEAPYSRIDFRGRSTGGRAHFINQHASTINFTTTLGPSGDGRVSAGKIDNVGQLWIGTRTLFVNDAFRQVLDGATGYLNIVIYRQHAGSVVVTNRAYLGGVLRVNVVEPIPGREYKVVTATKGLVGRFDQVEVTNVNMPFPRVTYTPNEVVLSFDP